MPASEASLDRRVINEATAAENHAILSVQVPVLGKMAVCHTSHARQVMASFMRQRQIFLGE